MKKILILSYHFPPNNHTSTERVMSWVDTFSEIGHQVTVVTRNWDIDHSIKNYNYKPSGTAEKVSQEKGYELHTIPFNPDFSLKAFDRFAATKYHNLYRLILIFFRLFIPIFSLSYDTIYRRFYNKISDLIQQGKVDTCIISVPPFMMLKIGYKLKKKFPQVHFIADYRDDWSSNEVFMNPNNKLVPGLLLQYDRIFEKKWLKNYTFFVSVTNVYIDKIKKIVGIPGYLIENGFLSKNYDEKKNITKDNTFVISYVGSLSTNQPVEMFIEAVKNCVSTFPNIKFEVNFIGALGFYDDRLRPLIEGYEDVFLMSTRLPKQECIKIQQESDMLLHIAYVGSKGIPGSKIYEYLAIKKPVLVFPNDHDLIFDILGKSKQGIFVDTVEEGINLMHEIINNKIAGKSLLSEIDNDYIKQFDRSEIGKMLADKIVSLK